MVYPVEHLRAETANRDFLTGFETQKELDPDFIAFNSENRRYHFPLRFYLPSRGVFGQVDLITRGDWGAIGPIIPAYDDPPYQYVASGPTVFGDPLGGQGGEEGPGLTPAEEAELEKLLKKGDLTKEENERVKKLLAKRRRRHKGHQRGRARGQGPRSGRPGRGRGGQIYLPILTWPFSIRSVIALLPHLKGDTPDPECCFAHHCTCKHTKKEFVIFFLEDCDSEPSDGPRFSEVCGYPTVVPCKEKRWGEDVIQSDWANCTDAENLGFLRPCDNPGSGKRVLPPIGPSTP